MITVVRIHFLLLTLPYIQTGVLESHVEQLYASAFINCLRSVQKPLLMPSVSSSSREVSWADGGNSQDRYSWGGLVQYTHSQMTIPNNTTHYTSLSHTLHKAIINQQIDNDWTTCSNAGVKHIINMLAVPYETSCTPSVLFSRVDSYLTPLWTMVAQHPHEL